MMDTLFNEKAEKLLQINENNLKNNTPHLLINIFTIPILIIEIYWVLSLWGIHVGFVE